MWLRPRVGRIFCFRIRGRMVMFPAWLKHRVPTGETTIERVSISFNLMFRNFAETIAKPRWKGTAGDKAPD